MKRQSLRIPDEGELWKHYETYFTCVDGRMRQLRFHMNIKNIEALKQSLREIGVTSVRNIDSKTVADGIVSWAFVAEDWKEHVKQYFLECIKKFQLEINVCKTKVENYFEDKETTNSG